MRRVDFLGGQGGSGTRLPVRTGLISEYNFDQCKNLIQYSQVVGASPYTQTSCTFTTNATTAPDGTTTAEKVTELAAVSYHAMRQTPLQTVGSTYTTSAYFKSAERTWAILMHHGSAVAIAYFDLTNGVVGTAGGTRYVKSSIENAGNGWFRCSMTSTAEAANSTIAFCIAKQDNELTYLGVAGSGIYMWGLQIEGGSALRTYFPTTDKQTLTDYSGNSNNFTLGSATSSETNDPSWTSNGAYFVTDDYITGSVTPNGSGLTFEAVIYSSGSTSDNGVFFQTLNSTNTNLNYINGFYFASGSTNKINLCAGDGSTYALLQYQLTTNAWYHLTGVITAGVDTKLYSNGSLVAATTHSITPISSASPLMMGRFDTTYLPGTIAYAALYNRPLTPSGVKKNHTFLKNYLNTWRSISI